MKYIHIKTGRIYTVISTNIINATNKNDGEIMVLYKGLKSDKTGGDMFVREYNEFYEKFKPFNNE